MANITNIIGGQPYLDAATGNMKNKLLNFWKGTQAQYDALKQTSATTSPAPGSLSTVEFYSYFFCSIYCRRYSLCN